MTNPDDYRDLTVSATDMVSGGSPFSDIHGPISGTLADCGVAPSPAPAAPAPDGRSGTYIASRASIPGRAAEWRRLRDDEGHHIVSSWIDEDGTGQTLDFSQLWVRVEREIAGAQRLVLYAEPGDFPLKGALTEVGLAIASRIPVIVVAPGVELEPCTYRPLGSWVAHPLVSFAGTMAEALASTAPATRASAPEALDERTQKLLQRAGMLSGVARHIKGGKPMTKDIADMLSADANHILRELAALGISHCGISDTEAAALRSAGENGNG